MDITPKDVGFMTTFIDDSITNIEHEIKDQQQIVEDARRELTIAVYELEGLVAEKNRLLRDIDMLIGVDVAKEVKDEMEEIELSICDDNCDNCLDNPGYGEACPLAKE